jgi:dCMP deaminase
MDRRDLILLVYVPVLHEGYRQLFERYRTVDTIAIFGKELIEESDYLHKEIRALDPQLIAEAVRSWHLGPFINVVTSDCLQRYNFGRRHFVMPDEDVCQRVAKKYLWECTVDFESVFLRWDRKNTLEEHTVQYDRSIPVAELDQELIGLSLKEAEKSSDWWRQVGAVAVRDKKVLLTAFNRHMPSPHTPYVTGDPRNVFSKGVNIELGTALHAEKGIICEAAKRGISLDGAYLYVSTFPCPPCAKAIVAAGFKRCYYSSGYAMLDGESILKQSGIEVVYVPQ